MSSNTHQTPVAITGSTAQEAPYWSRDVAELSAALGSVSGDSSSENAAARLRQVGPNSVEEATHLSARRPLLRQFESPLVLILIIGGVISLALGERVDATIILAIVLGSSLLGFFEGYRASAAVEELKRRLELTCRVVRDGKEQTVPASTVVPGDVIVLSAGNLIPAGAAVFQTTWFVISLLTEVAVVLVLRTRGPALRSKPSRMLLWTSIVMGVFALAIPYLGRFASAFGFVPLSGLQMVTVLVITAGYIAATEGAKAWFYKPPKTRQPVAVA
jgi:magnesium-transporting ATPase (P-type)